MLKTKKQTRFKALTIAVALASLPLISQVSYAAGLGRITVQSALGQPLRAQLEVSANRDELNSLQAQLASADAFRLAGVDYAPALSALRFSRTIKEEAGRKYIEVSTDRPLNEPFIDMLVELSWTTGRLVREYTFLLDPPEIAAKAVPVNTPVIANLAPPATAKPATVAPAPVVSATPVVAVAPTAPAATVTQTVTQSATPESQTAEPIPTERAERTESPKPKERVKSVVAPAPVAAVAQKPAVMPEAERQREVKAGDTLGKLAQEFRHEGVSLDQMLVAMFQENPEAFDGNMNRLRVGKIVKAPAVESVMAIDAISARQEVVAQSKDFEAYRNRLASNVAAAPAKEASAGQDSKGKIAPKLEEAAPAIKAGTDKLSVSRTEAAVGKDASNKARLGAMEEDLVARERALKEANSRISDLEKNLNDLKKLAELKSQAGAAAQKSASAASPASVTVPAKSAESVASSEVNVDAKPVAKPENGADAKVGEAPATVASAPAAEALSSVPTTPVPPKPAVKKVVPIPEPEEEPEPDFMEENAPLVFGGGGAIALLLGYLGFAAYKRKKQAVKLDDAPLTQASVSANSVFSETASASLAAGAVTDANDASIIAPTGDLAASIDPLEEADTYLAFGKDSQAEEILLDALRADPGRLAVHLKLLEIYAGRRSTMQFNTLAEDLRQQTGGNGTEWERAAEMGRSLDPNNPLYQEAVVEAPAPVVDEPDTEATMVFSAPPAIDVPEVVAEAAAEAESNGLDFDLGLDEPTSSVTVEPVDEPTQAASADDSSEVAALDFDLDLGEPAAPAVADSSATDVADDAAVVEAVADTEVSTAPSATLPPMDIDFDLELPETPKEESVALALDMDLSLPEVSVEPTASAALAASPGTALSMDLSLDLPEVDLPTAETSETSEVAKKADAAPALDFDFDLGDASESATVSSESAAVESTATAEPTSSPTLDFDLDMPEDPADAAPELAESVTDESVEAAMPDNPEAATKLELALAYEEMGDRDGARELFEEVLSEGSPSQQATARSKLEQLG